MVIHLVQKYPQYLVVNYDKVDYCSSFEYLKEIENEPNYEFIEVSTNSTFTGMTF